MSLRDLACIPRAATAPPTRASADAAKAAATLSRLASAVLDEATEVRQDRVTAIVRHSCPHIRDAGERMRLWGEYLAAVKQESDLLDGLITWMDVDPEINTIDRTQDAIDMAVEMSRQALEQLTGGTR